MKENEKPMLRCSVLCLLFLMVCLPAADLPLGVVVAVDDRQVTMTFDQDTGLVPDDMVALYGPGTVEKHPLTEEVIVEKRQLLAKAQVLAIGADGRLQGRVTWLAEGSTIAAGWDAVPLPGEASPDAPPVMADALPATIAGRAQDAVTITLPVNDPEARGLICDWQLRGTSGAAGRLGARVTSVPSVVWYPPTEIDDSLAVELTARDAAGQVSSWTVPLTVEKLGDRWRQRSLTSLGSNGRDGAWSGLRRDPRGGWWAIEGSRSVVRIAEGWSAATPFVPQEGVRLSAPVAMHIGAEEVAILDKTAKTVLVLARDGVLRRQIGSLRLPTDLAVDTDGTVYVGDAGLGGVFVYEANGLFRCRLGRPGEGSDAFKQVGPIDLGPDGMLYVLDVGGNRVHTFNRHHRRGPVLEVPVSDRIVPVDVAWHPLGPLVLLSDGRVLVFNEHGDATRALPPLAERKLFARLEAPTSLAVDGNGEILVAYGANGAIARYDATGAWSTVRAARLWTGEAKVVDGLGQTHVLDRRLGTITSFDAQGWFLHRLGGMQRSGGPFATPGPMAVSPDGRWLCVVDLRRLCVVRFDLSSAADQPLIFGQPGKNPGQFDEPVAIAIDDRGRVYVVDEDLHRVSIFNAEDGALQFTFGSYQRGRTPAELIVPAHIAVAPRGEQVYIYDAKRYEIMKFAMDHAGRAAGHVGNGGGRGRSPGQFSRLVGLACDRAGLLYALDSGNRNLQVIDFRQSNPVAIYNLGADKLPMRSPTVLAVSPDGHPWISDRSSVVHGLRWTGGE